MEGEAEKAKKDITLKSKWLLSPNARVCTYRLTPPPPPFLAAKIIPLFLPVNEKCTSPTGKSYADLAGFDVPRWRVWRVFLLRRVRRRRIDVHLICFVFRPVQQWWWAPLLTCRK